MADILRKQSSIGLNPSVGKLTFDAEGTEGGAYHSRKLHVPDKNSGVTIGRGYDMQKRDAAAIINDLTASGIQRDQAIKLSKASRLTGAKAEKFIADNKLGSLEISSQSQMALFKKSYDAAYKDVKRISTQAKNVKNFGKVDFKNTHPAIVDLAVDLRFRGDYTIKTREYIQKPIAGNDLKAVQKVISNRHNWTNVPQDRFDRRVNHINDAVRAVEKAHLAGTRTPAPQIKPQAKTIAGPAHANSIRPQTKTVAPPAYPPARTQPTVARSPAKIVQPTKKPTR
jgi:hypothetical protein